MPVHSRSFAHAAFGSALVPFAALLSLASLVGCSSSDSTSSASSAGAATSGAGQANTSGGATSSGGSGSAGQPISGGAGSAQGGASSSGAGGSSSAGASTGGSGNSAGSSSAGSAGTDPGDTPDPRPINVTVGGNKQITHEVNGNSAGLDTRTTQIGKLAVDLGVTSGGYQPWLGKRGFHVMGVSFYMCPNINTWSLGRDYDGDCRLNTWDGLPHGTEKTVAPADSISAKVKSGLQQLQAQFPTEDWGFFLNADGSVRWSDVAFTGMSHGATTAVVIGKAVRTYRVISRSGPRDNTCGTGAATADFNAASPPWNANCPDANIASWLDAASATPVERFYSLSGKQDVEFGDIMFAMERMHYVGEPVRWDITGNVLTGTNRFYADAGHLDFLAAAQTPARTSEALNIAFGVPTANQNPTF